MPKCPKCGKEIDFLENYQYPTVDYYHFYLDSEGNPQYEYMDGFSSKDDEGDYYCPECGEKLFDNEEDAIKFLKGGEVKR
jgi:DNA-directed RNA polymerase subunit RPC12/RpoP